MVAGRVPAWVASSSSAMGGQQQQRPVHRVSRRSSRYGHRFTWIKHARGSMVSSAQQHHPLADELRQQHHTSSMSATWCPNTLGGALIAWALTYEHQTAAITLPARRQQHGCGISTCAAAAVLWCGVVQLVG